MINDQTLEEAFCTVLQPVIGNIEGNVNTDVRVVRGEQDAPRPRERTYIDVRLADYVQSGQQQAAMPTEDSGYLSELSGSYRLEFRVRAIGRQAKAAAAEIEFALSRPDVVEAFNQAGLSFSLTTNIVHIPILLETAFEPRAQFQAVFHATQSQMVDLGYIASIENIDGSFDGSPSDPYEDSSGEIDTD